MKALGALRPSRVTTTRVAMVVGGFPSSSQPQKGIFNLRAAQALCELADVHVIHIRSWRPGRQVMAAAEYGGVPLTVLAVPRLPGERRANTLVARALGGRLLVRLFRTCEVVHSVDACIGILASHWARRAGARHVTQVIGSDINSILPRVRDRSDVRGWERYIHGVACNSQALADRFRELYPSVRNVRTIYRGVDLDQFHPGGEAVGPLRREPPVRFLFLVQDQGTCSGIVKRGWGWQP